VEPISSKILAAKRGENGGKPVERQKSRNQLDEWYWEKTSKNPILRLTLGLLKGPGV
jgi:hypothetical protein